MRLRNEAPKRCDVGSAKEVQPKVKPDQSGATSGMWIDGARPQTREQPLVISEKVSESEKISEREVRSPTDVVERILPTNRLRRHPATSSGTRRIVVGTLPHSQMRLWRCSQDCARRRSHVVAFDTLFLCKASEHE